MRTVIDVRQMSKKYRLVERKPYYTLRDTLSGLLQSPQQILRKREKEFIWALRNVSLSVAEGEILGILGNNGAGKSTLLKLLSRVTPPTAGEVTMRGRIGSLLEVGAGFHPELSGRENIYLNGAILGMTHQEVQGQFDEIVAFAEVEKFLDMAMKHYSTGMYLRLAFAVAAHLPSEIMLVDEVLAVGDIEFQKKCLGKMGDISKQGRTILFVSHNMGSVQQLCTRCIVLEKGKLIYEGVTQEAVDAYLSRADQTYSSANLLHRPRSSDLSRLAQITSIMVRNGAGRVSTTIDSQDDCSIVCEITVKKDVKTGMFLMFKDENKRPVLLLSSAHMRGIEFQWKKGKRKCVCAISTTNLTSGRYSIDCGLLSPNKQRVDFIEDAVFLTVKNSDPYHIGFDYNQQLGAFHVGHTWKVE